MIIFSITHLFPSAEPLSNRISSLVAEQRSRSQVAPRPPRTPLGPPTSPPLGPLTAPDRLFDSNDTSRRAMATTATRDTAPPVWISFPAPGAA